MDTEDYVKHVVSQQTILEILALDVGGGYFFPAVAQQKPAVRKYVIQELGLSVSDYTVRYRSGGVEIRCVK